MSSHTNNNNNNRNDEDSKDMSVDIQIQQNIDNDNTIITISSNPIKDKQSHIENMKNSKKEICKCGDPLLHKDECSLYCGLFPCDDELVKLPKCDHYMHKNCLESLLYTRLSKCPLCRASINTWRRSKHYQKIEKEITEQFDSDTEQAILLSQKMFEQEQKRNSPRRNKANNNGSERDRSRSRERDTNRNNNRNNGRNNNRNRRVTFGSILRSRNRNRNNNERHSI